MNTTDEEDRAWNGELDADEPFIDGEWLSGLSGMRLALSFPGPDGTSTRELYEYEKFLGYGSNSVTFGVHDSRGKYVALKMERRNWSFPSYIRELPMHMRLEQHRDLDVLNWKLERLCGDPMLDRIVVPYDQLYRGLVDNLHGWPPFDRLVWDSEEATQTMWFGVRTNGTRSRLEQLASASTSRPETVEWARGTAELLAREHEGLDPQLDPNTLHANPIYVWGAAVMEGFFGKDSRPAQDRVRSYLESHSAELPTFVAQAWAVSNLLDLLKIPNSFREFAGPICDSL